MYGKIKTDEVDTKAKIKDEKSRKVG